MILKYNDFFEDVDQNDVTRTFLSDWIDSWFGLSSVSSSVIRLLKSGRLCNNLKIKIKMRLLKKTALAKQTTFVYLALF